MEIVQASSKNELDLRKRIFKPKQNLIQLIRGYLFNISLEQMRLL